MLGYLGVVRSSRLALSFVVFVASACGAEGDGDAGIARDAGRDTGVDAGPRCEPADGLPTPLVCNGHASLCDRLFDDVAYATTHNAMSSDADGWIPPNQGPAMWQQLEDGVRAMMLDTYEDDGETLLCHGICALGSRPFVDALRELRLFMDCHPAEVITLILEAHIDEARFEALDGRPDVARAASRQHAHRSGDSEPNVPPSGGSHLLHASLLLLFSTAPAWSGTDRDARRKAGAPAERWVAPSRKDAPERE